MLAPWEEVEPDLEQGWTELANGSPPWDRVAELIRQAATSKTREG
ncbi:hypothetical protein [Agrilutibacter solisilvae]|nr:hypothetical protein [Lysobacter solisilvae]